MFSAILRWAQTLTVVLIVTFVLLVIVFVLKPDTIPLRVLRTLVSTYSVPGGEREGTKIGYTWSEMTIAKGIVHIGTPETTTAAATTVTDPIFIIVPGGAFISCSFDAKRFTSALNPLKQKLFVLQYPTLFNHTYRDMLNFIITGIEWVRRNTGTRPMHFIAHSAGAHILANALIHGGDESTTSGGNKVDLSASSVFLFDGYYGMEKNPLITIGYITGAFPNKPLKNLLRYKTNTKWAKVRPLRSTVKHVFIIAGENTKKSFRIQSRLYAQSNATVATFLKYDLHCTLFCPSSLENPNAAVAFITKTLATLD